MFKDDVQLTVNPLHTPIQALPPSTSPDAFDTLSDWISSPDRGYDSWIAHHQLSEDTKKIYSAMWKKFSRWLASRGIGLADCEDTHLETFLNVHGLEKEHRQRYVRLVEKTYGHLQGLGLDIRNPGREAGFRRVGKGDNDPTAFLDHGMRAALFQCIRQALVLPAAQERRVEKSRKEQWIEVRDAAVAATLVGAGAKVSELTALTVSCTSKPGWLLIPSAGNVREHRARLYPIAQEALNTWLDWRKGLALNHDTLFPASLTRRRNDQQVGTAAMHPATVFRRIKALLEQVGATGDRACGQTLRNTYAAMLFENGADDSTVYDCLGMFSMLSVQRLRASHQLWLTEQPAEHT